MSNPKDKEATVWLSLQWPSYPTHPKKTARMQYDTQDLPKYAGSSEACGIQRVYICYLITLNPDPQLPLASVQPPFSIGDRHLA